jgi:hypothetical protein
MNGPFHSTFIVSGPNVAGEPPCHAGNELAVLEKFM